MSTGEAVDVVVSGITRVIAGAAITFNTATDDFVLGVDRSRDALIRAVAVDDESGGEFNLIADDQYSIRQNKIGYFGSMEEGRVVLDNRVLVGKIIGAAD